jgi:hypothetical protein
LYNIVPSLLIKSSPALPLKADKLLCIMAVRGEKSFSERGGVVGCGVSSLLQDTNSKKVKSLIIESIFCIRSEVNMINFQP